jgi:site-specific recombinase XerD
VPLLVAYVDNLPMPDAGKCLGVSRLERLRDGAPLHMLLSSGMRREGILTLNRADVEDGWRASAAIIGKGSKERRCSGIPRRSTRSSCPWRRGRTRTRPVFIRLDNRRGAPGLNGEHWRPTVGLGHRYSKLTGIPATTHHFRHAMASAISITARRYG